MSAPERTEFRALAFTACVAASLLTLGCASSPPKAQGYAAPQPGMTWEYQVTSTGSYGSGTATTPIRVSEAIWDGQKVLRFEGPSGVVLQTDKVGIVAVLDPAGRALMRYEPPLGYEWPLEVGKAWTQEHVLTVGATNKVPMKSSWKVESYEDVTVPAGTFKAWRITMTDNFGFRQTTWFVPEKIGVFVKRATERPEGHPQRPGTQVHELTKVPAVR